jgi:hypothetical protein
MGTYTKKPKELGPCHSCGAIFEKWSYKAKYCSDSCRVVRETKIKDKVICPQCNSEFLPTSNLNKCCSKICAERYRSSKLKKALQPRPCAVCETEFMPVTGSHKFCSFDCKSEHKLKTRKAYKQTDDYKAKAKIYNQNYVRYDSPRDLKDRNLQVTYGITIDQYEQMCIDQKGLCKICQKPPPGKKPLCVEHSHETGKVRGLVCIKCNNILGSADDCIVILQRTIDYLIYHHPDKAII